MDKKIIISIGREYASSRHEIAPPFAKARCSASVQYSVPPTARSSKKFDERAKNVWFFRSVDGYSNSIEENIAQKEFDFIKEKATSGESFVVVVRYSDHILGDNSHIVSCFVTSEISAKLEHIEAVYGVAHDKAEAAMKHKDKVRADYHNEYEAKQRAMTSRTTAAVSALTAQWMSFFLRSRSQNECS